MIVDEAAPSWPPVWAAGSAVATNEPLARGFEPPSSQSCSPRAGVARTRRHGELVVPVSVIVRPER